MLKKMKTTYHLHNCNQLGLTGSWDLDQFQYTHWKVRKIPNSGWMRTIGNQECWCKHPNMFQCCRQFLVAKDNPVVKNMLWWSSYISKSNFTLQTPRTLQSGSKNSCWLISVSKHQLAGKLIITKIRHAWISLMMFILLNGYETGIFED